MSDTTQTSGRSGAGEDEYTPTGTDQVAEHLAAMDDDEAELRAASLRAGLEDYDLDDEDAALLSGHYDDEDLEGPVKLDPAPLWTPAAGSTMPAASTPGWRSRRKWPSSSPTPSCS
ncbi:MAG: ribosome biosis GTPase Der [Arthrobacter sp.]|nr:ribosome biosis GTPase Der [Arthrobacter sp.]